MPESAPLFILVFAPHVYSASASVKTGLVDDATNEKALKIPFNRNNTQNTA